MQQNSWMSTVEHQLPVPMVATGRDRVTKYWASLYKLIETPCGSNIFTARLRKYGGWDSVSGCCFHQVVILLAEPELTD